jgi:aminopeptidase N
VGLVVSAAAAGLSIAAVGIALPSNASTDPPPAGAVPAGCVTGLGDRVQPQLGTAGVTVGGYDADLVFESSLRRYAATTTMGGTVRQQGGLRCLALDFGIGTVTSVRVNGRATTFRTTEDKIYVLPAAALASGRRFSVEVRTVTEVPDVKALQNESGGMLTAGIYGDDHWVQTLGQPARAHNVVPMADHPDQKAPWTFRLTVPQGTVGVANGSLVAHQRVAAGEQYVYQTRDPMATHVLQVAVGPLREVTQPGVGEVRVRHWIPAADAGIAEQTLARTPQQLAWLSDLLGPYPFREYGVLATPYGGELETQTLTILNIEELQQPEVADAVMLHELAHQWFGDSVSVRRWGSDLWLSEGHAVYYQNLYTEQTRAGALESSIRSQYQDLQKMIDKDGPVAVPTDTASPLAPYSTVPYVGGAVTLYALRQQVGAQVFQRIERAWLATYRNRSAGTEQFIALASSISHQDLSAFLRSWLYGTELPAMPGHPDWKSSH